MGFHDSDQMQQSASVSNRSMYLGGLDDYRTLCEGATSQFKYTFEENQHGTSVMCLITVVFTKFEDSNKSYAAQFKLYNNCFKVYKTNEILPKTKTNG